MTVSDLARTRFAYSPLTEVGESLHVLTSGSVYGLHREWYESVVPCLGSIDMELLHVVVPPQPWIADFLFAGAVDATTSIEAQLQLLRDLPHTEFVAELRSVWQRAPLPARAADLLDTRAGGPRRLADVLFDYWTVAIEPHWPGMRALLDEDVAHRAGDLTRGGVAAMLAGMHPELSVHGDTLRIGKRLAKQETQLAGDGMLLVPSVFAWPHVVFAVDPARPPSLTYPARGVGNLWGKQGPGLADEDPLSALIGRSRAEIMVALDLPSCTTDLALRLEQSPSAVSQHLSVLRRNGLVTSWRAGRRVLYLRTELATSIVFTTRTPAGGFAHDQNVVRPIRHP